MLTYPNIDPIIFSLGPFDVGGLSLGPLQLRWYSLMYVIGLVSVAWFLRFASKRGTLKVTPPQIDGILFWGLVGMILGARVTYVLVYNFDFYMSHPEDILKIWNGGLSFHGGFLGVISGAFLYCRQQGISYLNVTDHLAVSIPIGLGFGRIGNFINGELWGRVSDVPWAMVFPGAGPLPRHPSQIYESVFEGWVLLAVMMFTYFRRPKIGVLSGLFVLGYGIARFFIEFFRQPDSQLGTVLGPFSMGQILCMLMWALGGVVMIYAINQKDSGPGRA